MRLRGLSGLVVLLGCAPREAPQRPPLDACAAVTKADIQAVVGKPIGEPSWVAIPNGTMCSYQSVESTLRGVTVEMYPRGVRLRDMYLEEAGKIWNTEPIALAAVGDEAAWLGRQLIAVQGDDLVVVAVSGEIEPRVAREEATAFARKALERLR
jgi:hypothetical protein